MVIRVQFFLGPLLLGESSQAISGGDMQTSSSKQDRGDHEGAASTTTRSHLSGCGLTVTLCGWMVAPRAAAGLASHESHAKLFRRSYIIASGSEEDAFIISG